MRIATPMILAGFCYCLAPLSLHAKPALHHCVSAAANGTGASAKVAKFQVYEGLLQATGTAVWAEWMASGTTPGYVVKPVKYVCQNGSGLGISCRGQTMICKR